MKPTDRNALEEIHRQHGHAAHDGSYNEDVVHEHSDVNVRALLVFCGGLVVVVGAVMVAMWGLFVVFERQAVQNDPVMTPHAIPAGQLPPEPRLLTDEPQFLQQVRDEERQQLEKQDADPALLQAGRPGIEEAKKQLLEKGLPARATPVAPWLGTTAPARGEASGGRMLPLGPDAMGPQQPAQPAAGGPAAPKPETKTPGGGH